jgi:TetR/AcrR family transcriptional regulator, transcriptional repressor for nem operon
MTEPPKTRKGRATRDRIVGAASELIGERGVAGTSLDDVIELAGVSKSQLYHHVGDRTALLRAVVVHNTDGVLGGLRPLESWSSIRSWFGFLVALQVERNARGGCPLGSLAGQLAESDEPTPIFAPTPSSGGSRRSSSGPGAAATVTERSGRTGG